MKKTILLLAFLPFLSNAQIISTIAGNGTAGFSGDTGLAGLAELNSPAAVTSDIAGNLYIADYANNRIRKINTSGIISTIAGTGAAGYGGDTGPAIAAQLDHPNGVLADGLGNIYFADYSNHCIRKIDSSGIISTIAGTGIPGFSGDSGPATAAQLYYPTAVCIDTAGNIFIADAANQRIRKINTSGIISTIAGTGVAGYWGDSGPATAAQLYDPYGIAIDAHGNMYIGDQDNNRIRKIDAAGIISTYAGTGVIGYSGDGGSALTAQVHNPSQVFVDAASNNVYFADRYNNCVRKIDASGIINTIAGTGVAGFSGDGGPAMLAEANEVTGVSLDVLGNIYFADFGNDRIRKVAACINSITGEPTSDTVLEGDTAIFAVTTSLALPIYQWQEDPGTGFVNLANVWPYSGVTTKILTIQDASMYLNTTHYRCIVSDGSSCVDTSSSAVLIIRASTGVKAVDPRSIDVFPNPAHDDITIRLPSGINNGDIELLNGIGQVISIKKIVGNVIEFDLSKLPAGIYVLKISGNEQVIYKKVIKD